MNRRDFLRHLLALPIAAQYDFEKLLWVPKPIITVPAFRGRAITMEMLIEAQKKFILPYVKKQIESNDTFYKLIK